jgi:hypothetical protein
MGRRTAETRRQKMSVLIRGMEIPTHCMDCPFMVSRDNDDCILQSAEANENFENWEQMKAGCPLIEVPEPHGRLIDADALVEDLKRQCEEVFKIDAVSPDDFWITRDQAYNERLWKTWCESFFEYLKTRETIIPESEEGET